MTIRRFFFALLAVLPLLFAAGCDREGPVERAGERIDRSAEQAGERLERSAERAGDRLENAGDRARE